LTLYCTEQL